MRAIACVLPVVAAVLSWPVHVAAQIPESTRSVTEIERAALFPSAAMLEMGRTVAENSCADCHGADGMARAADQPHLAGQRAVYLYRVLQNYGRSGRETNTQPHASKFLNDDALLAVAAWYASLTPAPPPALSDSEAESIPLDDDPFAGIRPALKKCIKCHGETGNSPASGMPALTAQDPEYFVTSMMAYADGGRRHKLMKKLVGALDEATLHQMGLYYAVQDPLPAGARGEEDSDGKDDEPVPGNVAAGRQAAADCATCHGEDGNATAGDMPTLAGMDPRYFIKAMTAYQTGARVHESMTEALEGLQETDIHNLAVYYAAQQPVKRDVRTPFTAAEWIERCARCHGADGNSTDPRFPMLAGQNRDYLRKALSSYAAEDRLSSTMHAMAGPLSPNDIEQVVNYYSAQKPKSVLYVQLPCDESGQQ